MVKRRDFIKTTTAAIAGAAIPASAIKAANRMSLNSLPEEGKLPVVISTWKHGLEANEAAWEILSNGGKALDAVEKGVMVTEADEDNLSVGKGGLPDREGIVTLDACIMDENGRAGSVCYLQDIVHPISVARLVMEKTPHVMLAGEGAKMFALENGFVEENLLTEKAKKAWMKWRVESKYKPVINIENHDTIGMIAIDSYGDISGACTTSGAGYKMHGRVGDSPIIGAGLFVDNEIGGAVATGQGELVMKTLGSFLVVELMRQGRSPEEACEEAIDRIVKKIPDFKSFQVGYIALDKQGSYGSYAIHKGFNYAVFQDGENLLIDSKSYLKK